MEAGFFETSMRYGQYLQRLHRLYRVIDALLIGPDRQLAKRFDIHLRAGWLADDLSQLGLPRLPPEHPVKLRAPVIRGRSSFYGALYVLIGASLGARLLLPKANALVPAARGTDYFAQMARSAHWPAFLIQLESAELDSLDELQSGAETTFDSFYDHLLEPVPA